MLFNPLKKETTVQKVLTKQKYYAPTINITHYALQKMKHYCQLCDKEVGWLGFCKSENSNSPNSGERIYTIYDTFLVKQKVTGVTTELDEVGMQQEMENIMLSGKNDVNDVRVWGHSHVNMEVNPSGTDEKTFEEYYKNCEYFIRLIANKKGDMRVDIVLSDLELEFRNVKWNALYDEHTQSLITKRDALQAEVDALTKQIEEGFAEDASIKSVIEGEIKTKVEDEYKYVGYKYRNTNNYHSESKTHKIKKYITKHAFEYTKISNIFNDEEILEISEYTGEEIKEFFGDLEVLKYYTKKDFEELVKVARDFTSYWGIKYNDYDDYSYYGYGDWGKLDDCYDKNIERNIKW